MGRPAWQRQKALIIAGNGARNEALIEAASNIARALKGRGQAAELALVAQEPTAWGCHAGPACRPAGGSLERMESEESLRWSFLRTTSTAEPPQPG
jgi:NADH-quinone oxidoreductase subunit G